MLPRIYPLINAINLFYHVYPTFLPSFNDPTNVCASGKSVFNTPSQISWIEPGQHDGWQTIYLT